MAVGLVLAMFLVGFAIAAVGARAIGLAVGFLILVSFRLIRFTFERVIPSTFRFAKSSYARYRESKSRNLK